MSPLAHSDSVDIALARSAADAKDIDIRRDGEALIKDQEVSVKPFYGIGAPYVLPRD